MAQETKKITVTQEEQAETVKTIAELMDGMTMKQRNFCYAYVETNGNATESAKRAGYSATKDATAAVQGWDTLRNPNVRKAINAIMDVRMSEMYVKGRYYDFAERAKSEELQFKAVKEIATLKGMYNDTDNQKKQVSIINITLPQSVQRAPKYVDVDVQDVKDDS